MDTKQLQQFLIASNKAGYAGGNEKAWKKEKNHSTTIEFKQGDWYSHDNFFGGEPYGGRVVVFYKDKPVWMMVYYGWVVEGVAVDSIYAILRNALMRMPEEAPFRGPKEYCEKSFIYSNTWQGSITRYFGEEKIMHNNSIIYTSNYRGGFVDKRKGV